jgi:uncharacterized protein (TIGR00725 family)
MSKPRYQICVSGAAKGDSVKLAHGLAKIVGVQIIKQGHIVMTGATSGLPYAAAQAAKAVNVDRVTSIGISPAASRIAHVNKYHLPIDAYDLILYTGFDYTGRDFLITRMCDAMIMVGGRIGTLNELTNAIEGHKPVGVLLGSGGMTNEVEAVLKAAKRSRNGIVIGTDPKQLVEDVVAMIEHRYSKLKGA